MSFSKSESILSVESISKRYKICRKPWVRLFEPIVRVFDNRGIFVGLSKKFLDKNIQEFTAIENISLNLEPGESLGVVGKNGSGKSTLLKIISGVLTPTSGKVESKGNVLALLELGTGFDPNLNGYENIYQNGLLLGIDKKKLDDKIDEIEKFADIGDFIHHPIKRYSSGMKMRLAFSITTCLEPDILIIDEALAVGDDAFKRKCYARIDSLRERGCGLLFVSHSARTVVQLCDKAILLYNGRQILSGAPKNVIDIHEKVLNATSQEIDKIIRGEQNSHIEKSKKPVSTSNEEYDKNLTSLSVLKYQEKGAIISNTRIENELNQKVNLLKPNSRYWFKYEVKMLQNNNNVKFSMLLKSVEGFSLGGYQLFDERTKVMTKGLNVKVSFEFRTCLAEGSYFMNAGIRGVLDEKDDVYLHRIIDAVIFRVKANEDKEITSYIDFNIKGKLSLSSYR